MRLLLRHIVLSGVAVLVLGGAPVAAAQDCGQSAIGDMACKGYDFTSALEGAGGGLGGDGGFSLDISGLLSGLGPIQLIEQAIQLTQQAKVSAGNALVEAGYAQIPVSCPVTVTDPNGNPVQLTGQEMTAIQQGYLDYLDQVNFYDKVTRDNVADTAAWTADLKNIVNEAYKKSVNQLNSTCQQKAA